MPLRMTRLAGRRSRRGPRGSPLVSQGGWRDMWLNPCSAIGMILMIPIVSSRDTRLNQDPRCRTTKVSHLRKQARLITALPGAPIEVVQGIALGKGHPPRESSMSVRSREANQLTPRSPVDHLGHGRGRPPAPAPIPVPVPESG